MREKIGQLLQRLIACEAELGDPTILADKERYKALAQEHSFLLSVKEAFDAIEKIHSDLHDAESLLKSDATLAEMIKEEIELLKARLPKAEEALKLMLVPPDPSDNCNTIIEVRAGTGGDEAALFVGDVVRMYHLFADKMKWKAEMLSCAESELGGFKEYVMVLSGLNVYRHMKWEAGTHRVQRIPKTEAQGRIHTSAITVAALQEPSEDVDIHLDEKDLRIDTYRSSGAGGQHVNTTDSAVRITHIPTGVVAYCQQERSQHKNKEKAMRLLKAKILEAEQSKKAASVASERASQIGTGDRSERIRTYNFPQNRVTDHRINLTLHNLGAVMEGDLVELSNALVAHYTAVQ